MVVVSGYNNAELPKEIEILGKLFGKEKEAEKLTKFYQDNMDMVAEKIKDVKGTKRCTGNTATRIPPVYQGPAMTAGTACF